MLRLTPASSFVAAARCALLAAALPWLSTLACGDDASPDGGTSAGSGGQGGSAGTAGGSAGSAGSGTASAGSGGASGSAGASSAGSGGSSDGSDAGPQPDAGGGADASAGTFTLSSPAFGNQPGCGPDDRPACDLFPDENTNLGNAANVSPEINWTPGPSGTLSYAIALHDLTFSMGNNDPFTHWVMWNIPVSATGLPAQLPAGTNPGAPAPAGSEQVSIGQNDGYTGSGACGNVYEFVLYALDTASFDPANTDTPDTVEAAIEASSAVLATATMRARSDPGGPSCN